MHHNLLSSKIASFNINVKYHTILIYIWVFFVFPSQHLWQPRATFLRKCPVMSHIYSSVVLLESTIKTRCLLSQQVHNAAMTYTCHKCKNWWQHLLSLGPSVLMSLKNLIDKTYAYVFNSVSRDMFNQVIAKVFFWGGGILYVSVLTLYYSQSSALITLVLSYITIPHTNAVLNRNIQKGDHVACPMRQRACITKHTVPVNHKIAQTNQL